jgi:rhodanese-related sulfurtransferase
VTILDLRRNSDDDHNTPTTPHARRLDSDKLAQWAGTLFKDKEIRLFFPHGRSINNAPVDYLNKIINKARLIPGGFDSRKEAGGATVAKSRPLPRPTR